MNLDQGLGWPLSELDNSKKLANHSNTLAGFTHLFMRKQYDDNCHSSILLKMKLSSILLDVELKTFGTCLLPVKLWDVHMIILEQYHLGI